MSDYVEQIATTGLLFFVVALILGLYASGASDWDNKQTAAFWAWCSLGLAVLLFLVAIWGPVVW
jgi:hypothetical protein